MGLLDIKYSKLKEFKVLSPTAILGYGFPKSSFDNGMGYHPDLIAVDAGSVDPGPYYLGSGESFTNRRGVKNDLTYIIKNALPKKIPIVVGSCGGAGAKSHLDWCYNIVKEILSELKLHVKIGLIYADADKKYVKQKIASKKVMALDGLNSLTDQDVNEATNIVAQMGIEPICEALNAGCEIILAGRAYDPSIFAALPIMLGFDAGLSYHCGKILECATVAAVPGSGSDCALGIIKKDSFELIPLNNDRIFTSESVAAHSLYEKSDPYKLPGPGGYLDLSDVEFKQLDKGIVKVSGTKFIKTPYTVKLEGARLVGYRTISIAGTRDPIMISQIDDILRDTKLKVAQLIDQNQFNYQLIFHTYGKNGVMGSLEKNITDNPVELCIVIEAVASSQEDADTVCSIARSTLLHFGYPNRVSTAGNLAFPFSPSDIKSGPVYEFNIYHLIEVNSQKMFKIKEIQL